MDIYFKDFAVVSAKIEASEAGYEILKMGGNAFDAMIATDLALAVVYPNAGNLGGGGFMVYRTADGDYGSLDYREKAPLASTKDMYLDEDNNVVKGLSSEGALSIGVPGTVAGLFETYRRFGSLPLDSLFKPAMKLAKHGFPLTKKQAKSFNQNKRKILSNSNNINLFNDLYTSTIGAKNCAKFIIKLIEKNFSGIYNLGSRNSISKEKFALEFFKKMKVKLDYNSISCDILSVERCKYLGMSTKKIERDLGEKMPTPGQVINNLYMEYK